MRARLRPLAVPSLAVVALILAAVSGVVAIKLKPRFVEIALAGLAVFLLVLCGAEFVILASIAVSSTLFNVRSLPYLFGFSSTEISVFLLLGLILIDRLSSKEDLVRTPLDWPILLFIGAAIVSFLNARYNLETVWSFRNLVMRTVLVYLLFFAVTNSVKTRRQLMTLVGGMLVMATIVAGFMVAQQAVGSAISIVPGVGGVADATVLGQEVVGVARVTISGSSIVYVMLLPALILHATPEYLRGRKWLSFVPVVLLPLAIAFTFSRNLWIGALVGGGVFVLLSRLEGKRFVFLILAVVVGAVLLGSLLSAYFPRIDVVAQGLGARFNSLFAGDELIYDSSTQSRLTENEFAIAKFREYPILGIGPMADYYTALNKSTYFVHNAYLWILVDFGIVGFLPFLWLSVAFLSRGGLAWFKLQDPVLKGVVIGCTVSYIAILVASTATPKLLETQYVPLIGAMLGINEVAIRLEQEPSCQLEERR